MCAAQTFEIKVIEKPLYAVSAVLFRVVDDFAVCRNNLEKAVDNLEMMLRNYYRERVGFARGFLGGAGKSSRKLFGNSHIEHSP